MPDQASLPIPNYGDGSGVQRLRLSENTFAIGHGHLTASNFMVEVVVADDSGINKVKVSVTFITCPGWSPAKIVDRDGKAEDISGNGRPKFANLVTLLQ